MIEMDEEEMSESIFTPEELLIIYAQLSNPRHRDMFLNPKPKDDDS